MCSLRQWAETYRQRGLAIIGDGAAHRGTVAVHHHGLRIARPFHRALDRAHAAHMLLQFRLGVPIGLEDRPRSLAQEGAFARVALDQFDAGDPDSLVRAVHAAPSAIDPADLARARAERSSRVAAAHALRALGILEESQP